MIAIEAGTPDDPALPIVSAAFARSVTPGLVATGGEAPVMVFVNPAEAQAATIARAMERPVKIVVFGTLPETVARLCGLCSPAPLPSGWEDAAVSPPAPSYQTTQSPAAVTWGDHDLARASPYAERAFCRFDFTNEWNNLGFGAITAAEGPWSLAIAAEAGEAVVLAFVHAAGLQAIPFVTLHETETASLVWWNRPVGPVDSAEWAVIETFLADWRHQDRPCVPVVEEIPLGYECALTMRLDCDEDIASARPLFELYKDRHLPFSLAIKTGQDDRADHIDLLEDLLAAGGAVLSHSVSHSPNWGGSAEACLAEARGSIAWLEERLPGVTIRHAVSPFHQNPPYVPAALSCAGIEGFVGGIIATDPQALMARGGMLPGDMSGVVSHSQQCMLHGDCVLKDGDRLAIPKQAFGAARASRTLFGYLDHPFSPRYDYGWGSEDHRLSCHAELLDFIAEETAGQRVLWLNEVKALEWIGAKARLRLVPTGTGFRAEGAAPEGFAFAARWQGRIVPLEVLANG